MFNKYCENVFENLAKKNPSGLVSLMQDGKIPDSDLTFAAEILGSCNDIKLIHKVLIPLLDHKSPVVREGALMGLQNHTNEDILDRMVCMALMDDSNAVRTVAHGICDDHDIKPDLR